MTPLTTSFTQYIVTGALQSFYTSNYFKQNLSHGDTCPSDRASICYVAPSFSPSRPLLPSPNHRLIDDLRLHEHQLPPLGSCARRTVRNHEMRRFIRESMHAEADRA
jgi:hypothetical protein